MFINYQSSVLEDYQKKKADNAISLRLIDPTPAKIKEECIAVCGERYAIKDEPFLRTFFGKRDDYSAYVHAIKKHETDKFKPLVKYLRGQIGTTDEKNIELLAWLIDFQPRPFQPGKRYDFGGALESIEEEEEQEDVQEEEVVLPNDDNNKDVNSIVVLPVNVGERKVKFRIRSAIIFGFLIILIGSSVYLLSRGDKPTGPQSCMYWTGDHYQQVSCNQKFSNTLVVALDSGKLNHFRRITEPDTITGKSKGRVWYVKVDEGIEFYTSDGFHPIQLQKRLRPLTDYIVYKYVHHE